MLPGKQFIELLEAIIMKVMLPGMGSVPLACNHEMWKNQFDQETKFKAKKNVKTNITPLI